LVILDDTQQRYQVFLTAIELPTQTDDTQGQSSEIDDDDNDTLKDVLIAASSVSFCCLIVLLTTSIVLTRRLMRSSRIQQFSEECKSQSGNIRWKVLLGVFAMCRVVYSLTFTFNGVVATCNVVVRETGQNLADAQDFISTPLTAATSRLFRRLEELERPGGLTSVKTHHELDHELERLEGLTSVEREDDMLNSSVMACGQYVDSLLSFAAVHITPSSRLSRSSRALDRLHHIHDNFLSGVTEYIESQKVELDRVVVQPAVDDAKLRLSDLLDNEWLRYSRFMFQLEYTSAAVTTSKNLSHSTVRSVKFAAFLEAGSELNAVNYWTATVGKRYTPCSLSLFCPTL